MSKTNLMLVSLVAGIPGLILTVMLALAFVNYGGGPNIMFTILAGLGLVLGLLMGVLPAGVLMLNGLSDGVPSAPRPAAKGRGKKADDEVSEDFVDDDEDDALSSKPGKKKPAADEDDDDDILSSSSKSGKKKPVADDDDDLVGDMSDDSLETDALSDDDLGSLIEEDDE